MKIGDPTAKHVTKGYSIDLIFECARGLSALWVFMFHITDAFEASSPLLFSIAKYGYQGVPIFFVISGYCMYCAGEKTLLNNQHPNAFLKRRLMRVLPPFWASIIVLLALPFFLEFISSLKSGAYVSPSPSWLQFTAIDWFEVVTLTRAIFVDNGDAQAAFSPINAVYWSLAVELQFYFIMYLALFFRSNWKKFLIAILCLAILTATVPTFNRSGLFLPLWPAFFLGITLRLVHRRGFTPWLFFGRRQKLVSCIGSALMILVIFISIFSPCQIALPFSSQLPNLKFIMASAVSAILLWLLGGIEHGALISKQQHTRKAKMFGALRLPLCWLGQSSYSVYLLHGQLHRLPEMFVRQAVSPENLLYPLLTMAGTTCLCFSFYKFVEVPFQRKGRKVMNPKSSNRSDPKGLTMAESEKVNRLGVF